SAGAVKMQPKAEELKFVTKNDGYVHIHPSSVNYQVGILFVSAKHAVAELVKELRCELDQLLQDKIKNPSMDLCMCPRGSQIIGMIVKLVTTQ
ncbi:DHX57 helicase, partial [Columbina picui]|nr:DHX57 helicase [Columbina picui]